MHIHHIYIDTISVVGNVSQYCVCVCVCIVQGNTISVVVTDNVLHKLAKKLPTLTSQTQKR